MRIQGIQAMPETIGKFSLFRVGLACGLVMLMSDVVEAAEAGSSQAQIAQSKPQNAVQAESSVVQLDEVRVVAEGASDERLGLATVRSVIGRDMIEQYGDTTLSDVLRRVPGLSVEDTAGRTTVRMRGLGAGYTQVLINGQPAPAGFSINSLSPALIERIEVLRAPTADTSAQAIAGSINIILADGRKAERSVRASGSSERGARGAEIGGRVAGRSGPGSHSFTGSAGRTDHDRPSTFFERGVGEDGVSTLDRVTQRDAQFRIDSIGLVGNIKREFGDDDKIALEMAVTERRVRGINHDRTDTLLGALPEYSSSNLDYATDSTDVQSKLTWSRRIGDYDKLDIDLSAKRSQRRSAVDFLGFAQMDTLVRYRRVDSDGADHDVLLGARYKRPIGESHDATAGIQFESSRRDERREQVDETPTGLEPVNLDEAYDAHVQRLALYLQDEWAVSDRISAYLGLRWEAVRTQTDGNVIDVARNSVGVFSPIVQTVWRLSDKTKEQVRIGVSRTFKSPRPAELVPRRFIANNNTPTSPDTQGNPDLRAELAWGLDLAYERPLPGGLLSVSAYRRRIEGVILPQLLFVDERWIAVPFNVGDARVHGIETEVRFSLAKLWPGAPDVEMRAGVTRNWSSVSRIGGPDNSLDRQLPLTFSLGTDYTLKNAGLRLGADYRFEDARRSRQSDDLLVSQGNMKMLDVYARWDLSSTARLRLSVSNVLQHSRHTGAIYSGGSGLFMQDTVAAGDPLFRIGFDLNL